MAAAVWILYITLYPVDTLSVWDLRDRQQLLTWSGQVTVRYAIHGVVFLLLGWAVFSLFAARRPREPNTPDDPRSRSTSPGHRRAWLRLLGHAVLGVTLLALVPLPAVWLLGRLTFNCGPQLAAEAATGLPALLLGGWIGFWWRRGRPGLATQLAAALIGVLAVAMGLHGQLLQPRPLPFEPRHVTLTDKRDLLDLIQHKQTTADGHRIYQLSQHNLNKLITWWFGVESMEGKARVVFEPELLNQRLLASIRVPGAQAPRQFLNLQASGHCEILDQQLDLALTSLQVGDVPVPRSVSRWLAGFATRWISSDRDNLDLLTGVVSATVDGRQLTVVLSRDGIRARRIAKLLRQMGDHPDVTPAVREHLREFAELKQAAEGQEPLFEPVVRAAFGNAFDASSRSGTGAAQANRAAILALGIALGHVKLERAVGDCWVDDARLHVYRLPRHSRLRGRRDWARHFWVSAAMTLIVGDHVSDAAGLLKEELDALEGGSGFSFGDLMADQAGTHFARLATQDDHSARAIQAWILDESQDLDELMPTAKDLPEGLTETELNQQFGGVNGAPYRKLIKEMQTRLKQTSWYLAVER